LSTEGNNCVDFEKGGEIMTMDLKDYDMSLYDFDNMEENNTDVSER